MTRVLDWDGENLPEEMRSLPPGRYVVAPAGEAVVLTSDEEAGLRRAIASLNAGRGRSLDEVRARTTSSKK